MTNQMKIYIKNIMKINNSIIFIISILLSYGLANSNIKTKQNSLDEIQNEIENLENELKKQIQTQEGADEKLSELKIKIVNEKNKLSKNKIKEKYQSQLVNEMNHIIDSLKKNSSSTQNEKNRIALLINNIKINNEQATNQILTLNDDLVNIKARIDNATDTLSQVTNTIKKIVQETILINPPNDIEFIIESNTWDNFILYTVMYDILIDEKKELIEQLFIKKEKMNAQYNQNLQLQKTMISNRKNLNRELEEYQKLEIKLKDGLAIIEKILKEKKNTYNEIIKEYEIIAEELNLSKNKINSLKKEKNNIQNIQKIADDEKQRIEYALILKKESREKVENEIKKLLLKSSQYKGTDIVRFKSKLPWPMDGDLITKFGINISPTGTKFDYTSIEIVSNKILYLANEINPKNPNKNLVKQFQRIAMNLKEGDTGYGVFGPQTTKKWKEYNKINVMEKQKKSIISIHEGKVEKIKFIDPITGVLIIIRHNNNSLSTYSGHIDLIVAENDIVLSGQKIGLIKENNILAFTLLVNGKIVNPKSWLIKK